LVATDWSQPPVPVGGLMPGAAEQALVGSAGDAAAIAQAFDAAAHAADAQGDKWADVAYRQNLIRTLGQEVATSAFARAAGRQE
jgi:CO/xanthine dehydrogenase FAD-binding subunit